MSLDVHLDEPDDFNCVELHSSLQTVALAKGIQDFEYHVDCISGKRANYIANVFRVEIAETDSDDNNISVIIKTLVNTERQVLYHKLHEREVVAYHKVISKFKDIQNVLYEHERLELSECLYSNTENSREIIILEDLTTKGYDVDGKLAKYENLGIKEISVVLAELAKFHALSFVFQCKEPMVFKEISTEFHDLLYQNHFLNKTKLRDYFFESFEMSLKLVTDEDAKEKLEIVKSKLLQLLQMYVKPRKTNVFCHGDCWVNNMLFKHEAGKVCFIDFQAMRYANPVTDIMYFLFICTDSQFRSEHFDLLTTIYYDNLKVFLNKFDVKADDVYKREDFNADIEEFRPYGLLIAMVELRIVTMAAEDESIFKGSRLDLSIEPTDVPEDNELHKIRVNDVVKEAVDNGVLDKLIEKIKI
ncbi:uncharacterized protein LOC111364703 [Spodoptera litura]|uniref:Uncharacterized protein LOC111364703 n=1 Tax=Spodoptera litura TaxID=69820 RepID=A0A9J7J4H2_SPOLT|nr:uncharacterized protein LOC111364703 [Spodoptera litura]